MAIRIQKPYHHSTVPSSGNGGKMHQTTPRRSMRPPAALLVISMGVALTGCGEAATTKVEVPVRIAPENDRDIVVLIPQGRTVKVSNCSHGWCQVSWHGQKGYALAKNFSIPRLANGTTETEPVADQYEQDDNDEPDDTTN
jgi:uncharacterized protein YraI